MVDAHKRQPVQVRRTSSRATQREMLEFRKERQADQTDPVIYIRLADDSRYPQT
jgi:hypothetical protein